MKRGFFMATFAERLVEALELRRISAAELSRKINVDEGTISNYKKGNYEPKQKRTQAIANALGVSINWLLGADVPMDNEKQPIKSDKPISEAKQAYLNRIINMDDESFNRYAQLLDLFEAQQKQGND